MTTIEQLQNNSCNGCRHENENKIQDFICFECSRYYIDKFYSKENKMKKYFVLYKEDEYPKEYFANSLSDLKRILRRYHNGRMPYNTKIWRV